VQDFPAAHSPQMGFEGANVLFDSWVHPLMMGLEEHLLGMFREDFEFHDGVAPSHLGRSGGPDQASAPRAEPEQTAIREDGPQWTADAEKALGKVPFFVRGKARRNTETFAMERGLDQITLDTLYDAKAHYAS
jgi:light-independent protochlorophyllide reductase subunit B